VLWYYNLDRGNLEKIIDSSIQRIPITVKLAMKKIMLAIPDEMVKVLEKERKERLLDTVPETIRVILSEYLRK
jgi:putative heme iron utilization protein